MTEQQAFCEECREVVQVCVKKEKKEGTLKGEVFSYEGLNVSCLTCGTQLFIEEYYDQDLYALYDEYRNKHGIISLNDILEIPKRYAIGKRPLSVLLGWGELTFTRYCDGDLPTKQYSDMLQKIHDEPSVYLELLETNKERIKRHTYEKSKKAVNALLELTPSTSKIELCIHYLLQQCADITPLALQKALYYIQGFYYAFHETSLFEEDCQAWVHGPVYKDVYTKYRDYQFDPIKEQIQCNSDAFTPSEKAVLDSVAKYVCCYSGKVLEQFTHMEAPWITTRGDLPASTVTDRVISKDRIQQYFQKIKEQYHMVIPEDIKVYTQDMFEKI